MTDSSKKPMSNRVKYRKKLSIHKSLYILGYEVLGDFLMGYENLKGNLLLPNMKELLKTNRMSHFPPFYDDFFPYKFNFKD